MLLIAVAWLSIIWLLIKLLGPVIAGYISAEIDQFADKNPKWVDKAEKGLEIVKDLGLAVVEEVSHTKFPTTGLTDEQKNAILFEEAVKLLSYTAEKRGFNLGTNDIRRTIEGAVTAWKTGMRPRGL